ncbi:DUF4369 domain-containing protein [Prevotella sp. A2931]|uniref:DUF4369 domain-containing protein n=1 Tax=Prevotella illustrans TaxID=2800387 RepID=A0ABS3M4T4_9BACT|nr:MULTISPECIES: DUF4369 domain-containing protein [Prevotella]MBO1363106.1 DUF4369 domain-containing protein [Prevotella illustrans]PTL26848.1 AhpC/TSA family antioxidant [Prevotella sp. oral taxon 820]
MKQVRLSLLLLLTLVLVSCGTDSHHFEIDGRLINLNQGEFYVYSPDGGINGIDTIKVEGGRFAYEIACEQPCVLVIVFPNFSQQPVFAAPGKQVNIRGDASHLKELEVKGTKDNELMTKFRQQVAGASPPEMRKYADQFVKDYPDSPVSPYLVNQYFVQAARPDYAKALQLLTLMTASQPKNGLLNRLLPGVRQMKDATFSGKLKDFYTTDIKGRPVSGANLRAARFAVINVWASWSYESMDIQRQLKEFQRKSHGSLQVLSINVDATVKKCRETQEIDSITWPTVCDGRMFDGKLVRQLGLTSIPDNIVLKNGNVIAHGLSPQEMREKLGQLIVTSSNH